MLNYLEALRLRTLHTFMRKIELSLQSSHHTIKEFFERADANGLSWPVADGTTNASIRALLFPERSVTAPELRAQPDFEKLHSDLAKKGTDLTLLWEEYCVAARQIDLILYSLHNTVIIIASGQCARKQLCVFKHKPSDAFKLIGQVLKFRLATHIQWKPVMPTSRTITLPLRILNIWKTESLIKLKSFALQLANTLKMVTILLLWAHLVLVKLILLVL